MALRKFALTAAISIAAVLPVSTISSIPAQAESTKDKVLDALTYMGGFATVGYICDKICPTLAEQGGYMVKYVRILKDSIKSGELTDDPEAVADDLVDAAGDSILGEAELAEFGAEIMAVASPK